jgi:hypothetical protein
LRLLFSGPEQQLIQPKQANEQQQKKRNSNQQRVPTGFEKFILHVRPSQLSESQGKFSGLEV